MNDKIYYRFRWNEERQAWDIVASKSDFIELSPEDLVQLYRKSREAKQQIVNTAHKLREALIEEALEKSDYKEANEIIDWIKHGGTRET